MMFDFKALQTMGQDIELFTKQTGRALTDIASELRIANTLLAMLVADQLNDGTNVAGALAMATEFTANLATAENREGDTNG